MRTVTVKYQVGTYSGIVPVLCDENADNDEIISKAKKILNQKCGGSYSIGMAYESWKILDND